MRRVSAVSGVVALALITTYGLWAWWMWEHHFKWDSDVGKYRAR